MGTFDLQTNEIRERFVGTIDPKSSWQIGAIIGASGTGKTTIAKHLFPNYFFFQQNYKAESVIDDMPGNASVEEITKTLNSVGFSSPPSWLKPYSVLSNGEKMRVDLATCLLSPENKLTVFDEFTSVIDRQTAKIGSFAVQKAIRRTDRKFIAVSCHYDIVDWLLPDWILDTNSMKFENVGKKKDRISLFQSIKEKDRIGKSLRNIII
jgi:ABC-type ATPase with predicted acetyltransferase domain